MMILPAEGLFASGFPLYELKVKVLPESHSIEGRAKVTLVGNRKARLTTRGLDIKTFRIDGREYGLEEGLKALEAGSGVKVVEIDYRAVFSPPAVGSPAVDGNAPDTNVVDPKGIVLLSQWYPSFEGPFHFRLTVDIPAGYEAVSESEADAVSVDNGVKHISFDFPHPLADITLVAGQYWVRQEEFQGVLIRTYLFSEDGALADTYIENTRRYLRLYESMFGPFPYRSFSIVENRFQTGYSFPTYTLLGSKVIRLPFIPETSLGHEILHQWFGNYVYVDYGKGNWSEGLTAYLSDYWYRELGGEGAAYRKKMMIDYMNYVSADNEIALKDFVGGGDPSARAVGYGKSAMVFHMLRRKLGDDAFFEGLREFLKSNRYREASWQDIRDSLAAASGLDLGSFFDQWVERKGVPSFEVKDAAVVFRDGAYLLSFRITQKGAPFVFDLPARVETTDGVEEFVVTVNTADLRYKRTFPARPLRMFLDGDYDTMRRLSLPEVPPVISAFTGRKDSVVVVPEKEEEVYREAAAFFKERGYTVRGEKEVGNKELREKSLLVMSTENGLYRRLFAGRPLPAGDLVVKAYRNPLNPEGVVVVMQAGSREELNRACRKIFRYGNYSLLVFDAGRSVLKETADSDAGLFLDLGLKLDAVEPKKSLGLDDVIERVRNVRVVFVGESHTAYEHHVVQYEIIRRLYSANGRLVIGMEMFQRPFQKYLDQYVQGEITEEEFLRKTEYFDRWAYDYNLYRDILQFARSEGIPVIALNARKEIIRKVSREGIDSLTDDELAEIPRDMDMTNEQYRESLKKVFARHSRGGEGSFENFLQSQILWDETMAHSVAEALKKHPDTQMVVLAGNGHVEHSWGIPGRVKRLSGVSQSVILNYGGEDFDGDLADFVLFPSPVEPPESVRLSVLLEEAEGGVVVKDVMKGGAAEKGGIKKGDLIVSIDGKTVKGVPDIKIALLDRKAGDEIRVKVLRKRFLFGMKEVVLDIVF